MADLVKQLRKLAFELDARKARYVKSLLDIFTAWTEPSIELEIGGNKENVYVDFGIALEPETWICAYPPDFVEGGWKADKIIIEDIKLAEPEDDADTRDFTEQVRLMFVLKNPELIRKLQYAAADWANSCISLNTHERYGKTLAGRFFLAYSFHIQMSSILVTKGWSIHG